MAAKSNKLSLGSVIKQQRRQLELSQTQVAKKVGCRPNYIGYLESGVRRPSPAFVAKLAAMLDLDQQELFFLAYPHVRTLVAPQRVQRGSAWERFKANRALHTRHGVTKAELQALEKVSQLGAIRTERDFLFILQSIRQALVDE